MASASRPATESQLGCGLRAIWQCAAQGARVAGTGTLVNLMYAKGLTSRAPQWSFIARVQNLLDQDDGTVQFIRAFKPRANSGFGGDRQGPPIARPLAIGDVSLRRVLAGFSLAF
jgi:hypothetical protein